MATEVVFEVPGFVVARSDEWGPPVPYPGIIQPDRRNHGFVDLRDRPELAGTIPEAQKSIGLAELLRSVNQGGSPLMTLGCECHAFEQDVAAGAPTPWFAGIYVDVTFRNASQNASPDALVALAKDLLPHIKPVEEYAVYAMIVERLKTFFGLDGRFSLMMKPGGHGSTRDGAWAAMDASARSLADAVNSYVTARR